MASDFCGPFGFGPWVNGDLSPCFMESVLFSIANAFGIGFGTWRLFSIYVHPKRRDHRAKNVHIALLSFCIIAVVARLVTLGVHVGMEQDQPFIILSDFLAVVSWTIAAVAVVMTHSRALRCGWQFMTFFALFAFFSLWRFKTSITLLIANPHCVSCGSNIATGILYVTIFTLGLAYELLPARAYIPLPAESKELSETDSETDTPVLAQDEKETQEGGVDTTAVTFRDFLIDVLLVSKPLLAVAVVLAVVSAAVEMLPMSAMGRVVDIANDITQYPDLTRCL